MTEWRETTLEDLGLVERGRSRHRPRNDPRLFGDNMPFFQTGDVKSALLHMTSASQYYSEFGTSQSRVWEPGVTCITIAANIAETAVLGRRGCFPDSVLGFTPTHQPSDAYYVKYLLDVYKNELTSVARGTTQDNLSLEKLLSYRFRVPDAVTRDRISSVLRCFDELIENNGRRIELLELIAVSTYREWFVHLRYPGHEDATLVDSPFGVIPKDWKASTISKLVELIKVTIDPTVLDPATPAVGLEHIPRRQLTLDEWDTSDGLGSRKAVFKEGDVLFGKIRPYFHKVSVAPLDGICSTDAFVIRPASDYWGLSVLTIFSDEFVANATQTANGTKMPRADWKVIKEFPVVVPPLMLGRRFTMLIRDLLGTAQRLMMGNRELSAIRNLLLPKLVNGYIDVSRLDLAPMMESMT